jgi:predicted SAM-dependent methyltransferase
VKEPADPHKAAASACRKMQQDCQAVRPPMTTLATDARAPRLRTVEPLRRSVLQSTRRYVRLGCRLVFRRCMRIGVQCRAALLRLLARYRRPAAPARVCLGSGSAPLPGWLNVDLEGAPDLRLDLREPLPLRDDSVHFLYSEHLLEHLTCSEGLALLRECRRILHADGVLRIAMPDLGALVAAYQGDWRDQDWVQWPGHRFVDSAARMLNMAFHGWGHQYLYDVEELVLRLSEAGFAHTCRCAIGESGHAELRVLETRLDSRLIVEAWGPKEARA